jgi:hypothetical protein
MNYKLLILGIFLGIILSGLSYWFYNYVYNKNATSSTIGVTKNYLLDGPLTIPISRFKLQKFNANRFCIELWLFVNPNAVLNTSSNPLNIFSIGASNNSPVSVSSCANSSTSTSTTTTTTNVNKSVKVSLDLFNNTTLQVTLNGNQTFVITPNFFLQKWEQVIISIDQYLVDLYLDGKLMQSNVSSNTITIPLNSDIIHFTSIHPDSDIYVSGLNVKTTAMNPKTALNNYNNGKNAVNRSTQMSIALTKNENVSKNFVLF